MSDLQARKVFGIGFHKTGTTSLEAALSQLGYSVTGPNGTHDPEIATTCLEMCRQLSAEYDAFQDNPWPLVFREMDAMWPNAKFILTCRDGQSWIRSQVKHFGRESTPMREFIYGAGRGAPVGNECHYVDTMLEHNRSVRKYFSERPGKLLEFDLAVGDGWAQLCEFLGEPIPSTPFPHENKASSRSLAQRMRRKLGSYIRGA